MEHLTQHVNTHWNACQPIAGHHTHQFTNSFTNHPPACFGRWEETRHQEGNPQGHKESSTQTVTQAHRTVSQNSCLVAVNKTSKTEDEINYVDQQHLTNQHKTQGGVFT